MNETDSLRSFIGIQPPQPILKSIEEKISLLKNESVRWVRPEGRHITLSFLDVCDSLKTKFATQAIDEVAKVHSPFELNLTTVGVFPDWKRPQVLWVGVGGMLKSLERLEKDLVHRIKNSGFENQRDVFTPHITLGRFRGKQTDQNLIEELKKIDFNYASQFRVCSIGLHQRGLRPPSNSYKITHQAILGS